MSVGPWLTLSLLAILLAYSLVTVQRLQVPKLVVLITSARNNYAQRKAVRDTWMKSAITSGVKVRFVVGEACILHPDDRQDEYSCELFDIDLSDEVIPGWTRAVVDGPQLPVTPQFKFKVLHPITITDLSVFSECLSRTGRGVTVSLTNRMTQAVVSSAEITFRDNASEMIQESVMPITLPKGFEGLLSLNDTCEDLSSISSEFYCFPALVCVREITRDIPAVGFNFQLADKIHLREFLSERESRQTSWNALLQKHQALIMEEMLLHNDILMTTSIDVYRNLPDKVLEAIARVSTELKSHYIMKTDDDCFVNVSKILDKLSKLEQNGVEEKVWIGNFRKNWALDDFGKWAEYGYTGVSYPWFACGSGYIISSDVATWLSANKKYLRRFQGEDVSMGIWLSPLSINYHQDADLSCDLVDVNDAVEYATVPELSSQAIYAIHDNQ